MISRALTQILERASASSYPKLEERKKLLATPIPAEPAPKEEDFVVRQGATGRCRCKTCSIEETRQNNGTGPLYLRNKNKAW